jgi:hypothetical protein
VMSSSTAAPHTFLLVESTSNWRRIISEIERG